MNRKIKRKLNESFSWSDEKYNNRFIVSDETEGPEDIVTPMEKLSLTSKKRILSIDIGIIHLGMTLITTEKYNFSSLDWFDLIDITKDHCVSKCPLPHSNTFCDRIAHILYKYQNLFENVDVILIERQPPTGLTAIEQLFFCAYREKSILIAPNSVHKYFGMTGLDYETRKVMSEKIATKYVPEHLQQRLASFNRQHDIADSILFTLFYCFKQRERKINERLLKKREKAMRRYNKRLKMSNNDFLDLYRYIPQEEGSVL